MAGMRAEYFGAYFTVRTRALYPIAWLTELAVTDAEHSSAWPKEAVHECERAVGAFERARGSGPSVAPRGQR